MPGKNIAVVGTGDMGSAVGRVLVDGGHRVVTDLSGRSAHSVELAQAAAMEDLGSLEAVVAEAELILSILPPAEASGFAERAAEAIRATGATPVFAECNAIAPDAVRALAPAIVAAGGRFVDVGVVGPAPRKADMPTRFYASGADAARLLDIDVPEIRVIDLGNELGRASALKATYAGLNKGTHALHAVVLLAAERFGVRAELMEALEASQARAADRMRQRVPYLAATAERFVGEMHEIAAAFQSVGVTPRMHEGAAWLFEVLAGTPLASETHATLPRERSLDEAVQIFSGALD